MSEPKKGPTSPEEVMKMYAQRQESQSGVNGPVNESPANKIPKTNSEAFREAVTADLQNRQTLEEARAEKRAELNEETRARHLGYINLPIEDLPTGGIFYPEGTKISVRAASGGDIRHWSMINESSLTEVDDALNYIIEKCVTVSFPAETNKVANWKDLKEIDRLYVILAVRDFTFTDGHNELQVSTSETQNIVVKKDNINFIDISDKLMKYYNPVKRCFTFESENPAVKQLNFYMPCVGVTQWLKNYMIKKNQAQEPIDQDFIKIAPMLIDDYRNLNDRKYSELILKSNAFGIKDWSIVSKIMKVMEKAIDPKINYIDESGVEQTTPLNFRGGLKAIFTYNLDEELDL